jgi:hypothetical protein
MMINIADFHWLKLLVFFDIKQWVANPIAE